MLTKRMRFTKTDINLEKELILYKDKVEEYYFGKKKVDVEFGT